MYRVVLREEPVICQRLEETRVRGRGGKGERGRGERGGGERQSVKLASPRQQRKGHHQRAYLGICC